MTGRNDDWDEVGEGHEAEAISSQKFPGYREASTAPKRPPVSVPVPSCGRVLAVADLAVGEFCRRPGVELDLPGVVAAGLHLVQQIYALAYTAMQMERDERTRRGWSEVLGVDLREEFGSHLEALILEHADMVLGQWYRQREAQWW